MTRQQRATPLTEAIVEKFIKESGDTCRRQGINFSRKEVFPILVNFLQTTIGYSKKEVLNITNNMVKE